MTLKRTIFSSPIAFVANIAWAYVAYALCRIIYLAENWSVLGSNLSWTSVWEMMQGAWMFGPPPSRREAWTTRFYR